MCQGASQTAGAQTGGSGGRTRASWGRARPDQQPRCPSYSELGPSSSPEAWVHGRGTVTMGWPMRWPQPQARQAPPAPACTPPPRHGTCGWSPLLHHMGLSTACTPLPSVLRPLCRQTHLCPPTPVCSSLLCERRTDTFPTTTTPSSSPLPRKQHGRVGAAGASSRARSSPCTRTPGHRSQSCPSPPAPRAGASSVLRVPRLVGTSPHALSSPQPSGNGSPHLFTYLFRLILTRGYFFH